MSTMSNLLKSIFGSKEERDLKAIKPILANVLKEYERVDQLSDNQLREETNNVKRTIRERIASDLKKREELKSQLQRRRRRLPQKMTVLRRRLTRI